MKLANFSILASAFLIANTASANPERIAELKKEIRSIAIENIGKKELRTQLREQLQPLVDELGAFHTPANAEADLPLLEGAWKEIFSDDVEPEPPGFGTDRDSVYQVVTKDGYFYNLSNLKGIITVAGVLRGEYKPAGDFLNIKFTKVSVRLQKLDSKTELFPFVQDLESGKLGSIVPPGNNKAPNGPVGAEGNIRNIYIDQDFRIATGENFADGIKDLFVLDKVTNAIEYK